MTRPSRLPGWPAWAWPVLAGPLLAFAVTHPLWRVRAAQLVGDFGSHTLYQSFIGLGAVLLLWRGWRRGEKHFLWWPPAVALATGACVEGLKRATRLPRPDGDPTGFPSGHTSFVFAIAWLITQVYPRWAPLWYAVAVAVGWSRIEGHAHFPYQVLCGAALGTLIGLGISRTLPSRRAQGEL
jgi:membrane-associated phospholipid phosphatase